MVRLVIITSILLVLAVLLVGGYVLLASMEDQFPRHGDDNSDVWPE